jgi:hypothetical protein
MRPHINEAEYKLSETWFAQWVRGSGILATFAFAAIGFTLTIFHFGDPAKPLLPSLVPFLRLGITLLAISGVTAGLNILIAYLWIDAIRRLHMPSLVGKTILMHGNPLFAKAGVLGWFLALSATILIFAGLICLVRAALELL